MRRSTLVFLLAALSVALPLAGYGVRYGAIAPIYLFNGDSFYYFDVVKHSLGTPGFSFDGQYQTNGFHPLWEWLLVAMAKVHLLDVALPGTALLRVYYLNVWLLAVGAGIFCSAISRWLSYPRLAVLAMAPGLFWIFAVFVEPSYYCTWAYANGMESALALLCFSIALLLCQDAPMRPARVAGIAFWLGLATLARMDDVFVTASVAAFLLFRAVSAQRVRMLLAFMPFPLMIAAYLAYNRTHLGIFLPISGAAKAHLAFGSNSKAVLRFFLPVITGTPPTALRSVDIGFSQLSEEGGRIVQMMVPAVLCGVELLRLWRNRATREPMQLVHALAVGVVLKVGYDFSVVIPLDQGQWYFTLSIAIANFVLVLWLSRLVTALAAARPMRTKPWVFYTGYALWVAVTSSIFLARRNDEDRARYAHLVADSRPLNAKLRALHADRFLEFEDGFLGYVASVPSLGGLGLVLDPEAMLAMKQGQFLELIYRRGYRVALASGNYDVTLRRELADRARNGTSAGILTLRDAEFQSFSLEPAGGDGSADGVSYYRIVPLLSHAMEIPAKGN